MNYDKHEARKKNYNKKFRLRKMLMGAKLEGTKTLFGDNFLIVVSVKV